MKASVISHSYIAPENRKNIDELSKSVDVTVILPSTADDRIFDRLDAGPIDSTGEQYRVFPRVAVGGAQYLLATPDLGFRGFAPEIVHLEYDPWSIIFRQALVCRNIFAPDARLICTVKNNTYRRYPGVLGAIKHDLAQSGIRHVDHFIAASERVAQMYREVFGVSRNRITVMTHLAVDTALFAPADGDAEIGRNDPIAVGYCGRLDPDKGVTELIEAVETCRRGADRDITLELLGNGTQREALDERARSESWLRLHGPIPHDEVPGFLRRLDLFVLPARVSEAHEEHDAHALIEAMAVGLPCVGTRSGIIPEILDDGTGLLVEANATAPLARGIAALIGDPARMRDLGSRSRSKALDSFSLEAVATAKSAVYSEVLRNGG